MENPDKSSKSNIDNANHPNLHRALSTITANQTLVQNQRNLLAKNYRRTSINDDIVTIDHNDADASFILPNLFELAEDIRLRVMDNLVNILTMNVLEETKRLNWWMNQNLSCPTLYPLITSGDGNCLLHATSLAMWGFHDHALSMRKALNETLITLKANNSLYRRWRWTQSIQNKKYNLIYSEDEWNDEWKHVLRLSSTEPRIFRTKLIESNESNSTTQSVRKVYQSLEEFHVYVLANNIRRPIIIYCETILRTHSGEAISPIEFGGIYLPLEIPPEKCYKQPIFLAFDAAHFSALVPMESNNKSKVSYRIPLIDFETLELLPIHFLIDPGSNFHWPIDEELSDDKIQSYSNTEENRMNILEKYLNLSTEYSSVDDSLSSEPDDQTLVLDNSNSTNPKKLSRSSLNVFSKNLRQKVFQPFSSTKRISLKQHNLAIINENTSPQLLKSPPLANRHSNISIIVLVNFRPKLPKISEHMIQNYIQTCTNECQSKQIHHVHGTVPKKTQSSVYYRHHRTNTSTNQISVLSENIEEKEDIDDNEDLIPIENGQFAKNRSYVQRKLDQLKSNNQLHQSAESYVNDIPNKSISSSSAIPSSSTKRQLSSTSDNDSNNQQKRL